VETVKDDAHLLQQLAIISQSCAQSVHNPVKARSFKTVELVILQIYVVNNLGNPWAWAVTDGSVESTPAFVSSSQPLTQK